MSKFNTMKLLQPNNKSSNIYKTSSSGKHLIFVIKVSRKNWACTQLQKRKRKSSGTDQQDAGLIFSAFVILYSSISSICLYCRQLCRRPGYIWEVLDSQGRTYYWIPRSRNQNVEYQTGKLKSLMHIITHRKKKRRILVDHKQYQWDFACNLLGSPTI